MSPSELPAGDELDISSERVRGATLTASERPTRASNRRGRPPFSEPPLVLDRYRLQRRLGAGGFGTVWLAHDERLDREVAVKIVPRERVIGGRFEREARAAARLAHPGVVTLFEASTDDDAAYLVSELVRGGTLDELLGAGRLSDRDVVRIGSALCDALSHAHAQGVIHRDIKPSNILIPEHPASAQQVAKLTDFGVARVLGGDSLTRTGDVVGTAAYMAPEQAEGRDAGAAADLYSLALVLYEALTGVNPVRSSTAAHRARRLGAHMPPLRRQRRDLPRELGQAIDLALRPRARERGTLVHLRAALDGVRDSVADEAGIVDGPWHPRPKREPTLEQPVVRRRERAREDTDERPPPGLLPRILASLATVALVAWLFSHSLRGAAFPPVPSALVAGTIVVALPRVAWLGLTLAVIVGALASHHEGAALLLAPCAVAPLLLLPRSGLAWPLPVGAPAMGFAGIAGAWPAVAALGGNIWRRAALGGIGWLWLVAAEMLSGHDLGVRRPPGTPGPDTWIGSPYTTVHHVIGPLFSSGVLAPAIVWAAAAAALPLLVRGRSLAVDFVLVAGWAAALVSATGAAIVVAGGAQASGSLRAPLLGALLAGLVALAPSGIRALQGRLDCGDGLPGLP